MVWNCTVVNVIIKKSKKYNIYRIFPVYFCKFDQTSVKLSTVLTHFQSYIPGKQI